VFHETQGPAGRREFIVGFYGVAHHNTSVDAEVTFEIILHEGSNDVEILYGQSQYGDSDSVAGIQNEDGTVGLGILFVDPNIFADGDLIFDDEGFLLTTSPPTCAGRPVTILGGSGMSVLVGTSRDDVIVAGDDADVVFGRGGDDLICGGGGNDSLDGGRGNDRIIGGDGNDTIRGGPGSDRINGGRGADVCDGVKGADRAKACDLTVRVP
jgi:Ca2+-binding RTX toxin-like protein